MCISAAGQIVFGILMVTCLILTCISMFSSNWRSFVDDNNDTIKSGIFKFNCKFPSDQTNGTKDDPCGDDWWKDLKGWEKATVVLMILALITELLCIAWNIFTFWACCCKGFLIQPLFAFASFVAIFLSIAIIVYGANNKDAVKDIDWKSHKAPSSDVGYSFYMAVAALVVAVADMIVASVTVFFAKRCC